MGCVARQNLDIFNCRTNFIVQNITLGTPANNNLDKPVFCTTVNVCEPNFSTFRVSTSSCDEKNVLALEKMLTTTRRKSLKTKKITQTKKLVS